ncbi:MAG: hypothetical protein ABIC91_05825 [Nanoarchaeota archaeon]|nr:hypothetical protein [Nanoarchaeota archaeon]MBU1030967.1 hypothetical protein [Nanoarchaeota archaeon]MBU1850168.1 hypothetical protein [Nanoarchaeota archaeon]
MTDITNKLTTEEKEAYIKSVEKELKEKNDGNKYSTRGIITASSSISIAMFSGLLGPGTIVLGIGMILIGGTMMFKSAHAYFKMYKKIEEKKQEIEQTYKLYK